MLLLFLAYRAESQNTEWCWLSRLECKICLISFIIIGLQWFALQLSALFLPLVVSAWNFFPSLLLANCHNVRICNSVLWVGYSIILTCDYILLQGSLPVFAFPYVVYNRFFSWQRWYLVNKSTTFHTLMTLNSLIFNIFIWLWLIKNKDLQK